MVQAWKWSFREALSIVCSTYAEDWGKAVKQRQEFLFHPDITEIEDGHITGLMAGSGQPVIFIHGSPANAMRWSGYLENVPAGYQFISIDRMGFGNRGEHTPDLEKDFECLKQFISKYEDPIVLGHSLGGAMAVRLASQLLVKGLVLVAASIDPALERLLKIQKIGNHRAVSWALSRSVRHSNLEMAQLQKFMESSEKSMNNINCPVHIVHAQDDRLVPFAHIDYARAHFKDLTVTPPEEGGHSIPWTHQNLIMQAVMSVDENQEEAA